MFRREWRQQILILALLTAAVAGSIGLASAAYTITPVRDNAEFGAASHLVRFSAADPLALAADVAAARAWFDTHEVIYHRSVSVPGLFQPVEHRVQDPTGPLGGPRLALVEGAYPAAGQVAVTDGVADLFDVGVGATLALDGVPRAVVGIVENPGDLGDQFVLLAPSAAVDADEVTVLVDGSDEQALQFRTPGGSGLEIGSRQSADDVLAAVAVLVIETVGLLLVSLVAAASFVVVAHRRMRQLGVLAAIGATEHHLRLVTLVNGTAIGVVAAVVGAAVGFAGWIAAAPFVERAAGFRINEFDVAPWVFAIGMLLAVAAGTAAAWWPARSAARVAPVRALSGRPPEPRPPRGAAVMAAALTIAGVISLVLAGDIATPTSFSWINAALVVAGTVAVALGALFACPLVLRVVGARVGRLPITVRLAIRDLARFRARSGAALAAISLTLGAAVAVTVAASAAQAGADEGNLPENMVLIRAADGPFIPQADAVDRLQPTVDRVASSFSGARVTSLDVALDPAAEPDPTFGLPAVSLARRYSDGWIDLSLLYVVTPRLLASYGDELPTAPRGTTVHTRENGELALISDVGGTAAEPLTHIQALEPGYESVPGTLVTTEFLRHRGWVAAPSGRWLVETSAPPTTEQLAAARAVAAGAGLTVEVRDHQAGLSTARTAATTAGLIMAFAIVAMTIGLVRTEAGRDLRVLTATGATRKTRRAHTASTAGALAFLGALIGTTAAYVGLIAGFARKLDELAAVPVANLTLIVVALPLLATVGGWLVSGRASIDIGRQPMS